MYKFRKTPFMKRILTPFRHAETDEEPQQPTGPYQNIEKSVPTGGATTQPNMTGETLVAISAMRDQGPNSWDPGAAINNSNQAQNREDEATPRPNHQHLTVNTRDLTPATNPAISPVSPTSHHYHHAVPAAADISPITTSPASKRSSRASPFQSLSPPPIAAPPEPGTAIKIAGSEARIVRIPPRSSRATVSSSISSSSGGALRQPRSSAARAPPVNEFGKQLSSLTPTAENNYNRYNKYIQQSTIPLPLYATPGASTTDVHGTDMGYRPYHPSLGEIAESRNRTDYPSSQDRVSVGSGASIASSDVILPDVTAWPMPPQAAHRQPDQY